MSQYDIMIWTMVATALSAVAMVVAAFFAYRAWRTDRRQTSTSRVAEYVVSIATKPISDARDTVTAWNVHNASCLPPVESDYANEYIRFRADRVTTREEAKVRSAVFELLWALHRASKLSNIVADLDKPLLEVLDHHVFALISTVNDFGSLLGSDEIASFQKSANTANSGLDGLRKAMESEWPDVLTASFNSSAS